MYCGSNGKECGRMIGSSEIWEEAKCEGVKWQ
jgi:hypothetical protein